MAQGSRNAHEIGVWTIPLQDSPDGVSRLHALLSDTEQEKATRLRKEDDRRRYTIAHGRLREILSSQLSIPAEAIQYQENANGKPHVVLGDGTIPLQFSLSHSGDRALVAVSTDRAVGIDLERIDSDTGVLAIAERCFSKTEHEAVLRAPKSDRMEQFFQLWVCKEAYVKGRGEGIIDRLRSFTVALEASAPRLVADELDALAPDQWTLQLLTAPPGYAAALAAHNPMGTQTLIRLRGGR